MRKDDRESWTFLYGAGGIVSFLLCSYCSVFTVFRLLKNQSMSISIFYFLKTFKAYFFITISLSLKCKLIGRANTLFKMLFFPLVIIKLLESGSSKCTLLAQWLNFKNVKIFNESSTRCLSVKG